VSAQSEALDRLLNTTPEMNNAPGVALPLSMMTGNTQQFGQALAMGNKLQALNSVVEEHTAKVGGSSNFAKVLGFFGHAASEVTHPVGEAVGGLLHVAGAPLREVQHQYRYFHDVWDRHGPIDALLELIPAAGIMGVAAATDVLTLGLASPVTTLAAEAATGLEARLLHPDSWKRTTDGEAYLDRSGRHVSIGRDIGKAFNHVPGLGSQVTDSGEGWLSGAMDAIADLAADPLAVAGRLRGGALGIEGAGGYRAVERAAVAAGEHGPAWTEEVPVGLSKVWGGLGVRNIENAYTQYPRFARAVKDIASISNEGDLARRYGENLGPLIPRLAKAETPGEVMDVFRGAANTNEIISGRLPTRSFTRIPFAALYEGMADPTGNAMNRAVARMARIQNVFTPETMNFSSKGFSLDEKGLNYASEGIYRSLLMGMKPQDAADVVTELYRAGTPQARDEIMNGAWVKMFDNLGIKTLVDKEGAVVNITDADQNLIRQKLFHKLEEVTGTRGGGEPFARDATGRNASGFPTGDGSIDNVPVHVGDVLEDGTVAPHGDVGRRAFPDYQKVRHELMGLGGLKKYTGRVSEFWYDHYTSTVFKPMALATLGFPLRVASGEIIPQAMRGETWNLIKSRIALTAAKEEAGGLLASSEAPSVVAAVSKAARPHIVKVIEQGLDSPIGREAAERLDFSTKILMDNGGHIMNPAVTAGHSVTSGDADDLVFNKALDMLHRQQPPSQIDGRPLGDFEGRDLNEIYQWQHNLDRHAKDGPTRAAMRGLVDALTPMPSEVTGVQGISERVGTAIPPTATPEAALPEAWKTAAPVTVPPLEDVHPDAAALAQKLQADGIPWKEANKYKAEDWERIATAVGVDPPAPTTIRDIRRSLQHAEQTQAAAAGAVPVPKPTGPEVVRVKSGHYEYDAPEGKIVIKRVRPRGEASQWHVQRPGMPEAPSPMMEEAAAADARAKQIVDESHGITAEESPYPTKAQIDDLIKKRKLENTPGNRMRIEEELQKGIKPTHMLQGDRPVHVLYESGDRAQIIDPETGRQHSIRNENLTPIADDEMAHPLFGAKVRRTREELQAELDDMLEQQRQAHSVWESTANDEVRSEMAGKLENLDDNIAKFERALHGKGFGEVAALPTEAPEIVGRNPEPRKIAARDVKAGDKFATPYETGVATDTYVVKKVEKAGRFIRITAEDGSVHEYGPSKNLDVFQGETVRGRAIREATAKLRQEKVDPGSEEGQEFIHRYIAKAEREVAPAAPAAAEAPKAEVYGSLEEAKAAAMGRPAPPSPEATIGRPVETVKAPVLEAQTPVEEHRPIKFGRAKSGQYGFESYPEQGGVIGQGKIVKEGKQWNVTYPGEAEVGSTHRTLKEAQQAVQDFTAKSHATEMARRSANIAADIPLDTAIKAAERAARDWLDTAPEALLENNPRHFRSNVPGQDPHGAWAKVIVRTALADATKPGMIDAPIADALHMDVIHDIANGRVPDLDRLAAVDPAHRPDTLVGPAHTLPIKQGTIAKVANWGHTKIFSPMINYMAREPMYHNLVWHEYNGGLKTAVENGFMQDWEARMIAQQRASFNMSKLVHNLNERTYMSESTRNWMPFFFAETQAFRRTGQLLADDPGAFRRFQLASSMLLDVGNPQKGEDGSANMVFPGEGFLAQAAIGVLNKFHIPMAGAVPIAFTGTVQSLGPVFPLTSLGEEQLPVGPLAALGVKAATGMFPELTPLGEKIIGSAGMQQSVMDMLIPNATLRGMYHTFTGDHNRAFMNAQLYVIQDLARQQQEEETKAAKEGRPAKRIIPDESSSVIDQQDFVNRVKNQTRVVMGVRAILASINPTATSAEVGKSQFRDEVRKLIKEKGLAQGMQEFLTRHPDATPYTVFTSEANVKAPLSASSEVGEWLHQNLDTVKNYAYGGAWLIPQAKDTFDQGVYNEQLALSLRQRKAPEQFFKDIQIASSNNQYYAMKAQFDQAMTKAKGDPAKEKAIKAKWTGLKQAFGAQNPVWFEDYQSPERRIMRDNTIADFRRMVADPSVPQSPQFQGIQLLLRGYDRFVEASLPGRTDTFAKQARAIAEQQWDDNLDGLMQRRPELTPLIQKIFKGATVQSATQAATASELTPELEELLGSLTPEQLAGRTP